MRVAMARAGDGVPAIQIEILVAIAGVDPDALATFCGDGHLLVRGELELILVRHDQSPDCTDCLGKICVIWGWFYGFVPTSRRPTVSSNPNIKFIFCTAWPAAPFTRLSSAENTTICFPRAANPMSQKFVVFTQL